MWWVQWKRTCCSSCTSWALHKSQEGEVLWVQVTISIRRVWSRSLEWAAIANNVTRKIKKHVSRKGVWRMCDQCPPGREGTPLMVSGAFAVALSWMYIRIRCPIIQVPLLELHNKMTKINGLTLQQPFLDSRLEQVGLCQTIHSRQDVGWPTIIAPWAQLHVSM